MQSTRTRSSNRNHSSHNNKEKESPSSSSIDHHEEEKIIIKDEDLDCNAIEMMSDTLPIYDEEGNVNLDKFDALDYDGWGTDDDVEEGCASVDEEAIASSKSLEEAMQLLVPEIETPPKRQRAKHGKRKHLTDDEKAELTRQRNRENARSTRKRRKMYITQLQQVVSNLKAQQMSATQQLADPKVESSIHEQRTRNVIKFFELREEGVVDQEKWLKITSPLFRMSLPVTTYRNYPQSERRGEHRVFEGTDALIADTISLQCFVQNTICNVVGTTKGSIRYYLRPAEFLMVGDRMMCECRMMINFEAEKRNKATLPEIGVVGMCKCKFADDHRLLEMDLRFDVMGLTRLLEESVREISAPSLTNAKVDFNAFSALYPFVALAPQQSLMNQWNLNVSREALAKTMMERQTPVSTPCQQ